MGKVHPDASVMVLWPLATLEARSMGWKEIEPSHLLGAALKFAELTIDELAQCGDGALLQGPQARLQHCLRREWDIAIPQTSTLLRRALRRCGRGATEGPLHRSAASRDVFERGFAWAAQAQRKECSVVDLVQAILTEPDAWIARVLDKQGIATGAAHLEKQQQRSVWAEILRPVTPNPDAELDPVTCVLRDLLQAGGPQPCLLIQGPPRHNMADMAAALCHHAGDAQDSWSASVVDSRTLLAPCDKEREAEVLSTLNDMRESLGNHELLVFESLHRYLDPAVTSELFVMRFREWLGQTDHRFLFGIGATHYERFIERAQHWTPNFHCLWLPDSPLCVPAEL